MRWVVLAVLVELATGCESQALPAADDAQCEWRVETSNMEKFSGSSCIVSMESGQLIVSAVGYVDFRFDGVMSHIADKVALPSAAIELVSHPATHASCDEWRGWVQVKSLDPLSLSVSGRCTSSHENFGMGIKIDILMPSRS